MPEQKYLGMVKWINCSREVCPPDIVYVEDNVLRIEIWSLISTKLGLRLACYECPEDFLSDIHFFAQSKQFYFDQDLGEGHINGLELAKEVRKISTLPIFMVSSYPKRKFKEAIDSGLIENVFSKKPWPFVNEVPSHILPPDGYSGDILPLTWIGLTMRSVIKDK